MIVRSKEQIQDVLKLLEQSLYWTFDVETTGLNTRKDKLIGFGACNPQNVKQAFYIITKEYTNGNLVDVLSTEDILPVIIALKSKRLVTFNGSFDTRITLSNTGVSLINSIYCDVMLLVHTCDENKKSYGLKNLAVEVFGTAAKAEQQDMLDSIKANGGSEKEYYKADSQLMATYGLADNILTAQLYNYYSAILKSKKLTNFFYEEEVMPLYRKVTIPMELKGVPVDVPYIQQTQIELQKELEKLEDSIQASIAPHLDSFNTWFVEKEYPVSLSGEFLNTLAACIAPSDWPKTKSGTYSFSTAAFKKKQRLNKHPLMKIYNGEMRISDELKKTVQQKMHESRNIKYIFNILSKDHLKRLFFTKLEEEPISRTDLGSPQVDDYFLDLMANKYEWVKQLRTYNKLTKIKGTYVDRILEKQENGIFYPSYLQHRTTSGRYSGDLQQLPRIKTLEDENDPIFLEYNNRIRNFFTSGAGKKLIDADYTSLEVMVFADDSQDESLLEIIRNNKDLYSQVAINVFPEAQEYTADTKHPLFLKKHKPELRQQAKAFALGFRYGLMPFKLSKDLDIPEAKATSIHRAYFESFPQLKERMNEIKESAIKNGFVRSKGGRIRNLPNLTEYVNTYGEVLFDSLELWKKYNESPKEYTKMKQIARECRGAINNSLNFPIQSFAASIVSKAAIAIAEELEAAKMESYICMSTHDELCLLSPDSEVERASEILQRNMENTTKLSVQLQAEPIVGTKYGEVK
jgi:DNA polymerase I-like protein with 3'-5' exonuclease and polymerase domains